MDRSFLWFCSSSYWHTDCFVVMPHRLCPAKHTLMDSDWLKRIWLPVLHTLSPSNVMTMLTYISTWRNQHTLRCIQFWSNHTVNLKTDVERGLQLQISMTGRTSGYPNSRNKMISFTPTSGNVSPVFCWTCSSPIIVTPPSQLNSVLFTSNFNWPMNILVSATYWTPSRQLMLHSNLPWLSSVITVILQLEKDWTSRQQLLSSYHMTMCRRSTTINPLAAGEPKFLQ